MPLRRAGNKNFLADSDHRAQELQADAAAALEQKRQRRYLIRQLFRSPTFMVGLVIVLFWVFMAVFSMYITQSPTHTDPSVSLQAPNATHWFGTDDLGRDVLARTMAGARTVLIIAPLATILALLWGGIIGLVAGFYRGITDEIIMRLIDVLLALPDHHHLDPDPVAAGQGHGDHHHRHRRVVHARGLTHHPRRRDRGA